MESKNYQCSVAIQVLPKADDKKLIEIVDKVIDYIRSTGQRFIVGPFETTIEGDFDPLMDIVRECQLICIREGAPQVMSYIKIAYSPGAGVWSIEDKIEKHR